ncbi:MAG: polysaccharide pyruvyl transferase CsaB [Fimbriimonadales bacterium]|nr:polysaccharide pyruvyl transferase CsaB [Fimbriimonadales bacterium]
MARLLFAGYLGCGNLGDDAVLLGLVHGLGSEAHSFTVMSGAPDETYRLHGFPSVPRRNRSAWRKAMEQCDAVVFPGGSIFQDATSLRSVYYYATIVSDAKRAGKPVALVGQGVGPLSRFLGKRWAAAAFERADAIVVRDPASAQTLQAIGVRKNVRIGADPAFLLPEPAAPEEAFSVGSMRAVGLAPRPLGKGSGVEQTFGELARSLFGAGLMPVLIEMDRQLDGPLLEAIAKRQGGRMPDLRRMGSPIAVQQRLKRMEALVAVRLHAGILAATVGVPAVMVDYDPKVAAFAKAADLPLVPATAPPGAILARVQEVLQDRPNLVARLKARTEELRSKARVNVEAVRALVG